MKRLEKRESQQCGGTQQKDTSFQGTCSVYRTLLRWSVLSCQATSINAEHGSNGARKDVGLDTSTCKLRAILTNEIVAN